MGSDQALARRPMEGRRLGLLMMPPMTSEINQAHHSDPDQAQGMRVRRHGDIMQMNQAG